MPSCFQLTRKGMSSPSTLNDIDRAICQHLEVPVDDVKYVHGWFDTIGLGLAVGHDFAKIGEILHSCNSCTLLRINNFLMENYTSDAFYQPKGY